MTKAAETFQNTIGQFNTTGTKAFKDGVDKSMAALNDANAQYKQNLDAVAASITAAAKGAETLSAQAVAFSKKSVEEGVAAAKNLGSAKSPQEVVELQTAYVKSATEAYVAEMTKVGETLAAAMKDFAAPISGRVTAAMEKTKGAR